MARVMSEEVEFETIHEVWNFYRLKDNSLLRIKLVLVKVVKEVDEAGKPSLSFNWANAIGISSPSSLKGQPAPPVPPDQLPQYIVDEDIDLKPEKEEQWSEYRLKDGTIMYMRLLPVKVSRTSLHDPAGDPIYLVNHQPIIKVKAPKPSPKSETEHPTFVT